MSLDLIWTHIVDTLHEHFVKVLVGFLLMIVGWYFGRVRAREHWKKQEFLDRLNISLNSIDRGILKIRTLSEKRGEEVFLNTVAAETVTQLARRTTAADPILPIAKDDMWYYLNAILNDLSEQFATGAIKRDMGGTVNCVIYLVALTCETAGDIRTRKVRAMVVKKSLLTSFPTEPPQFESDRHGTRWQTLQILSSEYAKNPWRFLEVELCV
ncbi:MAG: hypothetical protein JWP89_2026 [Schlesneria sp.]|nr:hypothetical protein [Schlesneria sp.]